MFPAAETLMCNTDRVRRSWFAGRDTVRRSCGRPFSPQWWTLGFLALVGVFVGCIPGSTQGQTLTQALTETYNTNPQLLAQRALLRATDEQVPQALANWRPTVNFTGNVGITTSSLERPAIGLELLNGANSRRAHEVTRPDALTLSANQPIYSGGRTVAQTSQAINTVESTRAQTLAVETSVFQAVAQA